MAPNKLPITVEFGGGLEMLFSNQRTHKIEIPAEEQDGKTVTIGFLIHYLCKNFMRDTRKEMFILDGHVRPGIIVLINDADWELEGGEDYLVQPDDIVLFMSTLHGG